ncbi:hypothetical protein CJF39_22515 [Pseudomonas lundensis]|uniref:Uncharacterized protein n=1 Tax=Pseudomonas lundensis TaxID=86185 RepID=A0A266N4G7_9PSED|nr:hypothetical protein CJF39_22515 [Pseudomonas lundensis]
MIFICKILSLLAAFLNIIISYGSMMSLKKLLMNITEKEFKFLNLLLNGQKRGLGLVSRQS